MQKKIGVLSSKVILGYDIQQDAMTGDTFFPSPEKCKITSQTRVICWLSLVQFTIGKQSPMQALKKQGYYVFTNGIGLYCQGVI